MSLKFVVLLYYMLCSVITYFIVSLSGNYGSSVGFKVAEKNSILFNDLIFGVLASYIIVYVFYRNIVKINLRVRFTTHLKLIDIFALLCISINTLTIMLDIGKAGGGISKIGFLQSLIPLIPCMILYFSIVRDKVNRLRICIIFIFVLLGLLKGWSGHVILLVLLESLYRFKNRISFRALFKLFILFLCIILIFYFIIPLKFAIRGGGFTLVSISDYSLYIFGRVGIFSVYSYLSSISNEFVGVLSHSNILVVFIKEYFLGVIPKSLIGMSDFKGLDNLFSVNFINPELPNAGFSITLPGLYKLAGSDLVTIFILTIFLLFIFIFQWSLLSSVTSSRLASNALFVNLLSFVGSGSLKSVALFNYILVLYLIYSLFFSLILLRKK
ncbi:oligosaccharide repeat unit polymerase [Vibrio cyclitrophicus]